MISHMARSTDPMCIWVSGLLGLKVAVELAVCGRLATAWGAVGCAAAIGCAEAEPSNGSGCALRAATAGRALLPGQRNGPAGRSPFAGIARIRSWGSPFSFSAAWLLSFPARLPGPPGSRAGKLRSQAAEKLNGDPQDLIRAMPAKGDRPAGPFL